MMMRIERLRVWLLASATLLLVVIAGFVGTARYLRRHWLSNLPAKLGANVKIDTSGITISHTYQGHTDYVVHAAKEVEHTDGKTALHDVWIKLCGRQQNRADMVRGDDWEWDQKAGVIRALGVVHIELRPSGGKAGCTATDDSSAADSAGGKTMWVTTSNLIYMQKLEVAATSEAIEFGSGTMQGHAVGADYASDSGTLMLHSAVSMKGMSAGQPVEIEAASAELDGLERVARLTGVKYATGGGDAARTATAGQAVLHLRADQTLERIEAQGNVTMQAGGGTVTAAKADVAMNAAGHPVNVLLVGGVRYAAQGPLMERRGEAEQAAITLDGKASPQAERAVFTGGTHLVERTRTSESSAAWDTRELAAAKVDVALAPGRDGKNEVRDAEAAGGARFSEVNAGKAQKGEAAMVANASATTAIAADDLKAHFAAADGASAQAQLETLSGSGHTLVRQVNTAGTEQTSAGDTLEARFRQNMPHVATKSGTAGDFSSTDRLASVVQTGHVVVTRTDLAKRAKDAKGGGEQQARVQESRAERASYDGAADRMMLSGSVQLTQAGNHLWASEVSIDRTTGDAQAVGGVNAEYAAAEDSSHRQAAPDGAEPVHVLAERADLDHATDKVTFHGAPARMWQGGSQVQAPVIEVERTPARLFAHGESGAAAGGAPVHTVHTVLMRTGTPDGSQPATTQPRTSAQPCAVSGSTGKSNAEALDQARSQVARISSGGLVYTDALGEAEFTGGFRAEMADATVRAETGTVYLKDAKSDGKTASVGQNAPSLNGRIDHVVAKGQVAIDRSGMRATGGQLLYTPAEQRFLLTGDPKSPPRAQDARGNVTTGAALEIRRACGGAGGDTVEVLNAVPGAQGAPPAGVHTEIRASAK